MKIFLDTADARAIRRAHDTGLLDGVTTNPTFIARSGRPAGEVVREIASFVKGPISVECMSEAVDEMVAESVEWSKVAPNLIIKLPMNPEGLRAATVLENEKGVHVNITMVFSPTQAFLAMKASATFVSLVLSRLDNVANESESLVRDAVLIKRNYGFRSEILCASLKTQNHVLACLRAGADIATIPETLFFQMYRHPLTDQGLEQFKKDWATVPK